MRNYIKNPLCLFTFILSLPALVPVYADTFDVPTNVDANLPNIILILADDMGWSDIGCYGGEIATPNLDRLAAQGKRFTQFFNTSKCFPSRACLLTGLYAQQCGMDTSAGKLEHCVTLAEVLRSVGYRTLMVGKHHGTDNLYERGFDRYWGMRDGATNHFNPGRQRPGEPAPALKRPEGRFFCFDEQTVQLYTPEDPNYYSTDTYTDWALQFLEEYRGEDRPFFLYVSYQAPHDPLQAWPEDIQRYADTYTVGYEAITQARYQRQLDRGLIDERYPLSKPTHKSWEYLSEAQQKDQALRMTVYAAMIDCMDRNIGRLLEWHDQYVSDPNNTLILFASDNGSSAEVVRIGTDPIGTIGRWASLEKDWANVSNTPFRLFKNYSYAGGICTPLIAHWPKVIRDAGSICHEPGHFVDIMATFLDITGAAYPTEHLGETVAPAAGQTLLPLLKGNLFERERPLFWEWRNGRAVLQNQWKAVAHNENWALFDLSTDKTETLNLANQQPQKLAELTHLHRWWQIDPTLQSDPPPVNRRR